MECSSSQKLQLAWKIGAIRSHQKIPKEQKIYFPNNFLPLYEIMTIFRVILVVPHKAVAEVSKIGKCRSGELL